LVAALACALILAGCQEEVRTRTPITPRPVQTATPDVTPTPTPVGPALAGSIPLRQGIGTNPSGLWVDEARHRLYVVCAGELDIVDTTTYRVIRVPLPLGTQVLAVDTLSGRVLLGGAGGTGPARLFLVDAETGAIVRTVELPAPPWRTLFLPERNMVVVALTPGRVAAVDMNTGLSFLVDAGGVRPILVANVDGDTVYLSGATSRRDGQNESALSVLDVRTGVVEVVDLPAPPTAFALHPRTHRLFILHQYQGKVTLYAPTFGVEGTLSLGGELTGIALAADLTQVYVSDWTGGRLLLLNAQHPEVMASVDTFTAAHFLQSQASAHRLILSQAGTSAAALIYRDGVTPLKLPAPAGSAAIHPSMGVSYVTIPSMNLVLALNPDGTEFMRWTLPDRPDAIVLDAAQARLFVSLPAVSAVAIVNLDTRMLDAIPPALVPSAAIANPADGLLYITDPLRATVHALGLERDMGTRAISVGPNPASLTLNTATGEVLTACADGLYRIRPNESRSVLIVPAHSAPLVGVSAKLNRIYVGLAGPPSSVQILDGSAYRLLKTVNVGGTLLALGVHDETGRLITLWQSPARPGTLTLSLVTGQTLEERRLEIPLSIPPGVKVAVRLDAAQGKVCIAYGSQTVRLVLVDLDTGEIRFSTEFSPVEDAPAPFAPFMLRFDTTTSKIYLTAYGRSDLLVLDSRSAISSTVDLGAGATTLTTDASRSRVYVPLLDGTLAILDGRNNTILERVAFGGAAHLLAADSQRQRVFVCDARSALVHVIRDPGPEPGPIPTPVSTTAATPSGTPEGPSSPWTTFANGDQVRTLAADDRFIYAGTTGGGIVRWDPADGSFRQYLAPQDGLPSNDIYGIAVDANREVWAATARGVSRFEGIGWNAQQPEALDAPQGPVRSAAAGPDGRVWFGTEDGGLHVLQGGGWEAIPPETLGLKGSWITEIGLDSRGRQWLASWQGVSVVDGTSIITYTAQNSGLPPGVVSALLVLTDDSVLAGTDTGLARFQGGAWTVFAQESGAPARVTALAQTADGSIWTASSSGIHLYATGKWTAIGSIRTAVELYAPLWEQVAARSQQWPIVFVQGRVWAILESGLADFDGQVWKRHSTAGAAPQSNQARALGLGPDGALWAGFAGNSIALYHAERWTAFTNRDQVPANVNAILTDTDGRVWFAADDGVAQYDGTKWTLFAAGEAGLLKARALALAWDPAGTLWVGTEQGLNAWRRGTWTAYTTTNSGLASNRVFGLAVDSDGVLWCATDGGVSRYDGEDWQTFTDPSVLTTEQEIWGVAVSATGHRWFGARHAVRRLAGESWFNYRDLREAIGYDYMRILDTTNSPNGLWAVDKVHGRVWVITEEGAAAYNGREWETYTPDNSGLASENVRSIVVDGRGAVWFATDKGISRLEP
jgi:ligand-binding sensor domain-containing protein/DNA-binding beta-propeller fold protein YncE